MSDDYDEEHANMLAERLWDALCEASKHDGEVFIQPNEARLAITHILGLIASLSGQAEGDNLEEYLRVSREHLRVAIKGFDRIEDLETSLQVTRFDTDDSTN